MPNHVFFENDALILKSRVLQLKGKNIVAALSKNQTLLIYCLVKKINDRDMVINYIWPGEPTVGKENCYHQLIYKTRRALNKNGFPSDIILTLSGFGVCIHRDYLNRVKKSATRNIINHTGALV